MRRQRQEDERQLPLGVEAPQAPRALVEAEGRYVPEVPPTPLLRKWPRQGDRVIVAVGIRAGIGATVFGVQHGRPRAYCLLRLDDGSPPMTVYHLEHMRSPE